VASVRLHGVGGYQGKVGHGDHAPARIAAEVSKGIKLLQVDVADAGLFF
jgi:hypothetical protein